MKKIMMECPGAKKCNIPTCSHYKLHELNKVVLPCNMNCGTSKNLICRPVKKMDYVEWSNKHVATIGLCIGFAYGILLIIMGVLAYIYCE